jgi:HD superfamily phosphohydrolase YqeK
MSLIEQIIFLSDFLEETRTFVSDDMREIAKVDLNKATYLVFDSTIKYLKKNKSFVSPLSLEAFDYYYKNTGGNG